MGPGAVGDLLAGEFGVDGLRSAENGAWHTALSNLALAALAQLGFLDEEVKIEAEVRCASCARGKLAESAGEAVNGEPESGVVLDEKRLKFPSHINFTNQI